MKLRRHRESTFQALERLYQQNRITINVKNNILRAMYECYCRWNLNNNDDMYDFDYDFYNYYRCGGINCIEFCSRHKTF